MSVCDTRRFINRARDEEGKQKKLVHAAKMANQTRLRWWSVVGYAQAASTDLAPTQLL